MVGFRRWLWAGLFVLLVVVGWSTLRRAPMTTPEQGHRVPAPMIVSEPVEVDAVSPATATRQQAVSSAGSSIAAQRRARRDALRDAIVDALARRSAVDDGVEARSGHADEDRDAPAGGLRDRMGGRDDLLEALNTDFMPLADECIEQARQRVPDLAGMLAVELEVIGDPDLGAVIETVGFPEANEVSEAELLECVRQTALSTALPPPPDGGRDALMITMPLQPTE